MKTQLISPTDLPFVQAVEKIIFCNPLLPERIALEQEALGEAYLPTERPWNVFLASPEDDPNLRTLVIRASEIAERCRRKLAEKPRVSEREAALYFHFICFYFYYRYREDFDHLIREAYATGAPTTRPAFFKTSQDEIRSFLHCGDYQVPSSFSYEHMFAFAFQIRRAFHHIFHFIIGTSPAATALRARIWQCIFTHDMERYLRSLFHRMSDIITLVTGPSGSGKELVAQAIARSRYIPLDPVNGHFQQDFMDTFYPVNLTALTPTLIESELFGHRKGSFTGALADHPGYLETCGAHGTVFLDEIGDVAASIQVKLLRVLQTRRFHRLGDTHPLSFDGKVIAATNRDLSAAIGEGNLRQDFYYRLCADRIETPSLAAILAGNPGELVYLVQHIAGKVAGEEEADTLCREVCSWVEEKMDPAYSWPGNFRELEQCVRNVMVHRDYHPQVVIGTESLGRQLDTLDLSAEELLQQYVTRVYARSGSYEEAGRVLEMDPRTVKKYLDDTLLNRLNSPVPHGAGGS